MSYKIKPVEQLSTNRTLICLKFYFKTSTVTIPEVVQNAQAFMLS